MYHDHDHDHDLGLAHDLHVMERMVQRRRALKWCAGAGTLALVAGCGSGSGEAETDTVAATATPTPTPTPTPSPTVASRPRTARPARRWVARTWSCTPVTGWR